MLLAGILQDVESSGSVYSIMAQLVTSNFVAICGSKFPPTVSKHCQQSTQCNTQNHTSNMQYQQSQLFYIQGAATSVQNHGSLCSQQQISLLWCLFISAKIKPQYHKIKFLFSTVTSCWPSHAPPQNVQLPNNSNTFNVSMLHRNLLITLLNWVTNYEYWIVVEWNWRCRFRLVFEMVYWRRIGIHVRIILYIIFNTIILYIIFNTITNHCI